MAEELAILGGRKAVTADPVERWRPPVEEQKAAVCELIETGYLSGSGEGLPKRFEEEFKEFIGCRYVLTLSHGHLALASAFFAAGLGAGDEFIHPALGYLGSYAGALHMGAKPVFCESDPKTLLADPADIERRITPRTRVINPIHHCGRVCDMDALLDICNRHGLVLVEDAAHAHGSTWDGRKIGSFGHIACFSMQGTDPGGKPVASGEGGILVTNDRELYERALIYAHLHRSGALEELHSPVYRQLDGELLGWKWRAHPLAVALARVSLKTLPERQRKFRENRDALFERLRGVPGIEPAHNYPKADGTELYGGLRFLYSPEELGGLTAERFCQALQAEGVPMSAGGFRQPEHLRAIFTRDLPGLWGRGHPGPANVPLPRYRKGDYPVTESLAGHVLSMAGWIECAPGLIGQVAAAIRKVVDLHKRLV